MKCHDRNLFEAGLCYSQNLNENSIKLNHQAAVSISMHKQK